MENIGSVGTNYKIMLLHDAWMVVYLIFDLFSQLQLDSVCLHHVLFRPFTKFYALIVVNDP